MSSKKKAKYVEPPPYIYSLVCEVADIQQVAPALESVRIEELMKELPPGVEMAMREAALEVWKAHIEGDGVWTGDERTLTYAIQHKGRPWMEDVINNRLGSCAHDHETDYELAEAVCANCLDGELDWRELDLEL